MKSEHHPILLASARPEWRTRYWLTEPLRLSRGTVLEVAAMLSSTAPAGDMPVRFTLDLVGAEADVAPN
ncbi:MAG: hypothetical protein QGG24_02370 [Vicinamibacterales bacterium]|jgi:hypothetical protein|nr:hypothetical protein [Acidobacteriota bacterium]MDP7294142.1 hypothetical protein [Vicinamibacterales bacterium]MDP7471089.1 hypothetical protein [Vicinamibacterales bacterium]MDP7672224.1 hypothetical protein [Vicinamibacterales bacterium]HJO37645.1 hypothetical protein [Vicinamibacterales bacterium]|tara:strand:+ start:2640 stop:2846 length:207 start_codon:yes stop_codon:yes gene_type:complete